MIHFLTVHSLLGPGQSVVWDVTYRQTLNPATFFISLPTSKTSDSPAALYTVMLL